MKCRTCVENAISQHHNKKRSGQENSARRKAEEEHFAPKAKIMSIGLSEQRKSLASFSEIITSRSSRFTWSAVEKQQEVVIRSNDWLIPFLEAYSKNRYGEHWRVVGSDFCTRDTWTYGIPRNDFTVSRNWRTRPNNTSLTRRLR